MIKTVSQTPGCKGCPMQTLDPTSNFVKPQRPNNPVFDLKRLVIAEAPGEKESKEGQPLRGRAGDEFNSLLKSANIPRDGLTIVNCINCRPPENVFPTDNKAKYISKEKAQIAVDHCLKHHVEPIIRERRLGQTSISLALSRFDLWQK